MKKNGFTLIELVIVLLIMGVISGAAISTFKTYDKGIKYVYSNTYYVLDRALYNATTYWVTSDIGDREPFRTSVYDPIKKKTVNITDTNGTKRLCRALIEYINPVESTNRDAICSESKALDDSGADSLFVPGKVQFTATNGVRYFISKRYPLDSDIANANKLKFYIIYADLNGAKHPNSMTYERGSASNNWKTKDPDVFAFAALENGRICPLGIPEVEPRYMTTRIIYQEQSEGNDVELKYSSPSRPYVYSKAEAWGYYLPAEKRKGAEVPDTFVLSDEPLTYNGYIKSIISSTSKIYAFLGDKTMSQYVQSDSYNFNSDGKFLINFRSDPPKHAGGDKYAPNIGGYSCEWMSDEECYILVDKYVE